MIRIGSLKSNNVLIFLTNFISELQAVHGENNYHLVAEGDYKLNMYKNSRNDQLVYNKKNRAYVTIDTDYLCSLSDYIANNKITSLNHYLEISSSYNSSSKISSISSSSSYSSSSSSESISSIKSSLSFSRSSSRYSRKSLSISSSSSRFESSINSIPRSLSSYSYSSSSSSFSFESSSSSSFYSSDSSSSSSYFQSSDSSSSSSSYYSSDSNSSSSYYSSDSSSSSSYFQSSDSSSSSSSFYSSDSSMSSYLSYSNYEKEFSSSVSSYYEYNSSSRYQYFEDLPLNYENIKKYVPTEGFLVQVGSDFFTSISSAKNYLLLYTVQNKLIFIKYNSNQFYFWANGVSALESGSISAELSNTITVEDNKISQILQSGVFFLVKDQGKIYITNAVWNYKNLL